MSEHQEFIELCALYTAGDLPDDQVRWLDQHLESCADCRRTLDEFHQITTMGLPSMVPEFVAACADGVAVTDRAQSRLLARIENEILARRPAPAIPARASFRDRSGFPACRLAFPNLRVLAAYAAVAVVAVSMSLYSYHLGARKIRSVSEPKLKQIQRRADLLQTQLSQLTTEHDILNSKLQENGRTVGALTAEIKQRADEAAALKMQERTVAAAASESEAKRLASESDRAAVSHKLAEAQGVLDKVQKHLEALRDERAADLTQMASLEKRLDAASSALKERDETIQQQRELLAYDRDIRDLIGARDLYVAEVTDVGRNGETQQPFGRVFYTQGKSLIFYAYDLDRQLGLRHASTFQAWGRRGPDFQQALPLGILYLDSGSNKRWVLKFDDPKALARIDAVFVTVEPRGGSKKPSGKPLLFAYLKVEPNHP